MAERSSRSRCCIGIGPSAFWVPAILWAWALRSESTTERNLADERRIVDVTVRDQQRSQTMGEERFFILWLLQQFFRGYERKKAMGPVRLQEHQAAGAHDQNLEPTHIGINKRDLSTTGQHDFFFIYLRALLGVATDDLVLSCRAKDDALLQKLRDKRAQSVGQVPNLSSKCTPTRHSPCECQEHPRLLRHWIFRERTVAHWWILRAISLRSQEVSNAFALELEGAMQQRDGDSRDKLIVETLADLCGQGIEFVSARHFVAHGAAVAIYGRSPTRSDQLKALLRELREELIELRDALE